VITSNGTTNPEWRRTGKALEELQARYTKEMQAHARVAGSKASKSNSQE